MHNRPNSIGGMETLLNKTLLSCISRLHEFGDKGIMVFDLKVIKDVTVKEAQFFINRKVSQPVVYSICYSVQRKLSNFFQKFFLCPLPVA